MAARVITSLSLTGLATAVAVSLLVATAQRTAPQEVFEIPQPSPLQTQAPVTEAGKERTAAAPAAETADVVPTVSATASPETAAAVPVPAAPGGTAQVGAAPDSGVTGLVLLGPVCPRPTQVVGCTTPAGATLSVFKVGTTAAVASVPIGPLGRFQIALQPGAYVLRVNVAQASTGPHEVVTRAVTVKPHEFALEVIRLSSTQLR